MVKKTEAAPQSEPVELQFQDTESHPLTHMTDKARLKLETELGIKRKFAVIDKQKQEIGEGPYFDDLCDEDPTGAKAREAFAWEPILVDLGEQADKMLHDRVMYFHGQTYKIRAYQVPSFLDNMHNSRRHDAEVQGKAKGLRNTKKNYGLGRDGRAVVGAGAVK